MVDFYFPLHTTSLTPAAHSFPAIPLRSAPSTTIFRIEISDGDGGSHMRFVAFFDLPLQIPTSLGITSTYIGEVVDPIPSFHISTSLPPLSYESFFTCYFVCPFLEDNESLKHGGVACSSLGEFVDNGVGFE